MAVAQSTELGCSVGCGGVAMDVFTALLRALPRPSSLLGFGRFGVGCLCVRPIAGCS